MNIVMLSGGSGKRLWPLSNEVRSKQFLKVIKDGENNEQSMIQRVYRQLKDNGLNQCVTIATSAAQCDSIKSQLGEQVSILIEPERRNTFPAIALSSAHLYYNKGYARDETIIVIPVDPFVENSYFQTLYKLDAALKSGVGDIVLMGVNPTYPSEKYGYIIPEKASCPVSNVLEFKEKPDKSAAQKFIKKGGLWNCGVFAFNLGYLIDILSSLIEFNCYDDVLRQYGKLDKISFDYAVVEKAKSVAVVPYADTWMDLGTWNTLTQVIDDKPIGNVKVSGCKNTHVINELEIPIVTMGVNNVVIVAGPDGILVSDKDESSYIKQHVDNIDQRPMFEEREWGEYKVLGLSVGEDGIKSLTKSKKIKKDSQIAYQLHRHRSEVWTVLSGECMITIDGRAHQAFAGDTYSIAPSVGHGLKAINDTEIIEIQIGKELIDDGTTLINKDGCEK